MDKKDIVIVDGCRTAIGRFGGSLKDHTAADLGVTAVKSLLERNGVEPSKVDQVIFGNGRQAGGGPNVARQIGIRSGIPETSPAWTVNMACGSGLKAVIDAARDLVAGEARLVVAGGTESMSRLPYFVEGARWGQKMGPMELVDGMYRDGFFCPMAQEVMGETVEWLAGEYGIPREEQDAFALESQARAAKAEADGRFARERLAVPLAKGGPLDRDEHARADTTIESLKKLPPVFKKGQGSLTAGNSSGITDGAAALLLTTREQATRSGMKILARLEAATAAGVPPRSMGIGPVPAIRKLLEKTGLALRDFGLFEVNEAFAAQVLCVLKDIPLPRESVNVNGGAIALGHPIGATGARILVTLLHEMQRRDVKRGMATLCISGGQGLAVSVVRD